MLKLRTILQGAAIAALATTSAYAADLPSRKEAPIAPVYAPPVFTWTGLYVGLNAGAAINDNRYNWSAFFNNYGSSGVAFTGGGQIGYNWQTGPVVLGLETDLNYRGASSSSNAFGFGSASNKAGYFGTVRGRLGYAFNHFMVYATGGLAYGNTSYPNSVFGVGVFGLPHAFFGTGNNAGTRLGWTVGAGAEYALNQHWSIKGEYLYVDLGKNTVNYLDAITGLPVTLTARNADHIVRAGVNYRF